MPEKTSPKDVIRLLIALQHNEEARRQEARTPGMDAGLLRLRQFQAERLAATYDDLLADDQYRAACRFFLDDLYGARDFSQRDHDAERLYAILARFLPEAMLRLLADTLQLNHLSQQLDHALAQALGAILEEGQPITPEAYAQGYRDCNNYEARRLQIELLAKILNEAARGARGTVFTVGLRLARKPAYNAGWHELHSFLERGIAASRPMKDISFYVNTIHQREMSILNNIFAGKQDWFLIQTPGDSPAFKSTP